MALNEIRGSVTLDSIMRKAGGIIEDASNNAYTAIALTEELCGPGPMPGEQAGRDDKAIGKLDVLDAILDAIVEQQRRTRYSLNRLDTVIRGDRETADVGTASGKVGTASGKVGSW